METDAARLHFSEGAPVNSGGSKRPDDQDVIDDFLLKIANRGLTLRGQFLSHLIHQAIHGSEDLTEQEVEGLVPQELLKRAKDWRREPDAVLARLQPVADSQR